MNEDFDANQFLKELEENKKDLADYNLIRNELCDLFQSLILEGKIQNKGYILAVGTLISAKSFIETVFPKEDIKIVYEKVLKIQ